ncbi:SRPBCC domain-containing protein [Pseudarthrobacter sp. NamE5]|uniref:SRPBCC family protein n=1 Tax=Pseudarthrobacter sp. NamE5 TaxID=2576839 RepID=UPI00110B1F53|nr:SRPBCC domain-containing protein [Pseudarthrobacter sp. NamE5]TLM81813.1 SRPBCC domain-containing protein [Pseudarthrobacter sp. NamE5]
MLVIDTTKNVEALSYTLTAEFDANVERVWRLWADPRQLERWWGPPTWPATFERFEFEPGGKANYYMTGPEGEKAGGWWSFTSIQPPIRLQFDDGFADEKGEPVEAMGATHVTVTLEENGGRTSMTVATIFESEEQMEQMVQMGMEEGMREAVGQIDAILAEHANA